jgi:hypothetical protein
LKKSPKTQTKYFSKNGRKFQNRCIFDQSWFFKNLFLIFWENLENFILRFATLIFRKSNYFILYAALFFLINAKILKIRRKKFKIPKTLFIRPFVFSASHKIFWISELVENRKKYFIIIISTSFRSLFDQSKICIFCQFLQKLPNSAKILCFLLGLRKNMNFGQFWKLSKRLLEKWSKIREIDLNSNFFKIFRKN